MTHQVSDMESQAGGTLNLEEILGTAFPCDHGLCAILGVYKLHLFSDLVFVLYLYITFVLVYFYDKKFTKLKNTSSNKKGKVAIK